MSADDHELTFALEDILEDVLDEVLDSNEKFAWQGELPMVGPRGDIVRGGHARVASAWKRTNAARSSAGLLAWDGIVLEEVYEAFAEKDPVLIRAELVQAAAMCAKAILALDAKAHDAEA